MGQIVSTRIGLEDADASRFGPPHAPHELDSTEGILRVLLDGPFRRRVDMPITLRSLREGVTLIFAALDSETVVASPHVEAQIMDATPPQWAPVAFRIVVMTQRASDVDIATFLISRSASGTFT